MIQPVLQSLFVAKHQLRTLLTSKRLLLIVIGLLLAVLLCYAAVNQYEPLSHFGPVATVLIMSVLVPLTGLLIGSTVISEEVEAKTLTYVITRPISRINFFLGRWLACAFIVSLALMGAAWWIGSHAAGFQPTPNPERAWESPLPEGIVQRFVLAAALGGVFYTTLAAWLSTTMRRPIIFGLGYAFVWEMVVGNLPGSTQRMSMQFYLRSIFFGDDVDTFSHRIPSTMIPVEYLTPSDAVLRLSIAIFVMLCLGAYTVRRKQYLLSS